MSFYWMLFSECHLMNVILMNVILMNVILMNVILMNLILINLILMNVILMFVILLNVIPIIHIQHFLNLHHFSDWCYAECHSFKYNFSDWCYAECHSFQCHSADWCYAEPHSAHCSSSDCRSVKRHSTEFHSSEWYSTTGEVRRSQRWENHWSCNQLVIVIYNGAMTFLERNITLNDIFPTFDQLIFALVTVVFLNFYPPLDYNIHI